MKRLAVRTLVALLVTALAGAAVAAQIYTDVAGRPEQRMLEKLAARGVFEIPQDRRFRPDDKINRLDFVLALGRAVGLREGGGTLPEYRDLNEIPAAARGMLAALVHSGTVNQTTAVRRTQEIEVIMETDKGTYGPGENIRLRLWVRNTSGRAVELEFPTSQQFDFIIRNQAGAEVARWSLGQQFTTQGLRLTVQPNQRVLVGETAGWRQLDQNDRPVPPGRYEIIGVVTSRPQLAPVTIFYTKGFVSAFPDNTFRPRADISRAEVAEYAIRASGLEQEAMAKRGSTIQAADAADVKAEHRGYVALGIERRMLALANNRVRPNEPATRLDAAVALDVVMEVLGRYNFIKGRLRAIQPGNPAILSISEGATIRNFRLSPVLAVYRNDRPAQLGDLKPNDELAMLVQGDVGDVTYIEAKGP
ncbi:MAG: BsuPI-related putative proteinase inhibitor [Armatimonadota bacterium]|nr:BsuPI-related putative proteinase inhibitor [Armatimonadota bacterium]MDR5696103.1 BsuPI-related putative proteinase inhibitor [Armatimonadota bacterium]